MLRLAIFKSFAHFNYAWIYILAILFLDSIPYGYLRWVYRRDIYGFIKFKRMLQIPSGRRK